MRNKDRTFTFLVLYLLLLVIFFISGRNYYILILASLLPIIKAILDYRDKKK